MDKYCKCFSYVCPAYAGMILRVQGLLTFIPRLSRVCGDDPRKKYDYDVAYKFVPRMRG